MDRGIARRPVFEDDRDARFLLACLARQVRAGDLELHAYSILTTHFHALVRSPRGRLSVAMQRALDAYARWFNRRRRRDGPLFRGRFVNRVIENDAYWVAALRYIDRNPVSAGMAAHPCDYRQGSARRFAAGRVPRWLSRDAVEEMAGPLGAEGGYARFCDEEGGEGALWVARRRVHSPRSREPDPLEELIRAPGERVREWMERKTLLADGSLAPRVLVSPGTVRAEAGPRWPAGISLPSPSGRVAVPAREVVEAGLLRGFCGLRQQEIAERMAIPRGTVRDRLLAFSRAFREEPTFRESMAEIVRSCLARDHRATRPPSRNLPIAPPGPGIAPPSRQDAPSAGR